MTSPENVLEYIHIYDDVGKVRWHVRWRISKHMTTK